MKVGIYTRISVDRDGQSIAPERQESEAQEECARRGWTVVQVYSDRNVSAFKPGVVRPEYTRMFDDVATDRLEAVVVWKLDRLSRSVADFMKTAEVLKSHGVELVSLRDNVDTSTPVGRMQFVMMGALAELEADTTAERVRAAHRHRAQQGLPHTGGNRAFGYSRTGEPIETEAKELQSIRQRIVNGESLYAIATDLNDRGVLTTVGNEWTTNSLSQTLRSPRHRGVRTYNGESYTGVWNSVFTEEEHLELLSLLSQGWTSERRGSKYSHLLSGVIRCGRCGEVLRANPGRQTNGKEYPRYQCLKQPGTANCGRLSISEPVADDYVQSILIDYLKSGGAVDLAADPEEIAALRAQKKERADDLLDLARARFFHKQIDNAEFEQVQAELRDAEAAIDDRLAAAERRASVDIPSDVEEWWSSSTLDQRRHALRLFVDSVQVAPVGKGRRLPPSERLTIRW